MSIYDEDENDSDLVKDLRKQLRDRDKDLKELKESAAQLAKRDRERTLKDTFKANGVPEKVAKFFPADQDATEDNVNAWLVENADVFGFKLDAPPADEQPAPEVPQGLQRLQAISQPSAPEGGDAAVLHQINSAASEKDLLALIQSAGGGGVN